MQAKHEFCHRAIVPALVNPGGANMQTAVSEMRDVCAGHQPGASSCSSTKFLTSLSPLQPSCTLCSLVDIYLILTCPQRAGTVCPSSSCLPVVQALIVLSVPPPGLLCSAPIARRWSPQMPCTSQLKQSESTSMYLRAKHKFSGNRVRGWGNPHVTTWRCQFKAFPHLGLYPCQILVWFGLVVLFRFV